LNERSAFRSSPRSSIICSPACMLSMSLPENEIVLWNQR
jgi:hypothetical protein